MPADFAPAGACEGGSAFGGAEKGIQLKLCCPEDFEVLYDAKWTSEALFNILDNAVKYSPSGGTVRVAARAYEMYGAVSVKDEGAGILEEEIPKIFGRFYRSEQVRQEEGVGIGLYLAGKSCASRRGYIKVCSTPGKGSVFTVFLPRRI